MKRYFHRQKRYQQPYYRLNTLINAEKLRVIDSDGKQIGIIDRNKALSLAQEQNLDLVEIAPNASPPVAKIIDFKKFKFEQDKKNRQAKKASKVEIKEIRLGPFTSKHDLEIRIGKARGFLKEKNRIKIVVQFKGRQITRKQFGEEIIKKFIDSLADLSKIERPPHFEGHRLVVSLSPN